MKFAAIDIGSNAVRLIFVNVYQTPNGNEFVKDAMYRVALQLGEDAFKKGSFSKKKIDDFLSTMKAFKHLINVHQPVQVMACATSAMRDAQNSKAVVDLIHKKTGIAIEVISGQREAELVLSNHVEHLDLEKHINYLYIDVGGGSTELALLNRGKTIIKESFNIGTIRLNLGKVKDKEWQKMEDWLLALKSKYKSIQGIGIGGNINSIQKIFSSSKKTRISKKIIETAYNELEPLSLEQKITQYQLKPDRAEVIVSAAQIFNFILETTDIEELIVPKVGLGDGMIHFMVENFKK